MQRLGLTRLGAMLSLVLVFGMMAVGLGSVRAQDDVTADGPGTPRPGHIHDGSCAELGDVVYALNNATVDGLAADYNAGSDSAFIGSDAALTDYISETSLDVSLDEIMSADHAVNFHLSGDEAGTYIACGDLGGFVHDGVLSVGLVPVAEFPDTQFAGSAILTDNGDNTTTVMVHLVELRNDGGATPAATSYGTPDATPDATPGA